MAILPAPSTHRPRSCVGRQWMGLPKGWNPGMGVKRLAPMRFVAVVLIIFGAVACAPPAPSVSGDVGILAVSLVAGPVCPVETEVPDPTCDPRPVAGAQVFVSPGDGSDIVLAQATSDENGLARFELPAGTYIVSGAEVAGYFGVPEPAVTDVLRDETASLTLSYDTGIR